MNDEIELTNQNSDSNLLSNENENSLIEEKSNKWEYFLTFPLNIILHILLLSICEMVLFFKYISEIENKALMNKINSFLKMLQLQMLDLNDNIYNFYLNLNQKSLENINENLYNEYKNANNERNENNNELFDLSIMSSCAILVIFLTYFLILYFLYRNKIKTITIFLEHIILMFFIGVFEFWFFTNIVMKYVSITNEEITYLAFNCLMKSIHYKYPEFNIGKDLYEKCNI